MGLGLVATGYGRPALDALITAVAAAKTEDAMALVTIIVPTNLAGIVARRHLAVHLPSGGVAGIEVTTLRRLAERSAAHRLAPRRPATRPLVAAAWRHALADAPGVFAEVAAHPATVAATSAAHRELREMSTAGLDRVGEVNRLTGDLVGLHRQVVTRLREQWYDEADLLHEAASATSGAALGQVIVHLPQELTASEAAMIRAAADATEVVVIAALTGVERADRAVRRSLTMLGLTAAKARGVPVAGRVLNASDSDDEVRGVVRDLIVALRTTPAHRVAVLYARASPYARLLHEQLAAAGITVNGPGARPIAERGLARALLETLELRDRDVPRGGLFTALGNAPATDPGGERIPVSRWERISREAGVVGGDDWVVRLDAYAEDLARRRDEESAAPEPRDWLLARLDRHGADTARLREFVVWLRAQLARGGALTTWRELTDWCLELHTTLFGTEPATWLPAEERYAAAALVLSLRSLGGLDEVEPVTGIDALVEALRAEFDAATPRVGRFGEGVLLAPMSAAIGLELDVVYAVGLSEDLFPGRFHEDPLLPQAARDAADGELASPRDRLDARHRHLLAALAAATESVASFPRGDLRRSTRRLPSRFLLPSLRALAGDKRLAATAWADADYHDGVATVGSYAGELLATAHLAGEQEWRIRQVAATKILDEPAYVAARRLLEARASRAFTRFDGNLAGVAGLPDLLAGEQVVSPTALEAYAICPHAYFVQRMLRVAPVEDPEDAFEISPAEIGTFMHEILDELISEHADALPGAGRPWSEAQRARMMAIAREKAAAFERAGRTGHARLWARSLERILDDLEWMVTDDDAWRSGIGATVLASEMPFGMKGHPPVAVPVPGGRILMRGSADKVDRGADGTLYVTDLKTGGASKFKAISADDPVVGGTKLQLPVYALAARERYGDQATPVEASYWFVRKDRGRIPLELTAEVQRTYAATLGVLAHAIAAGVFAGRAPEEPDFAWVQCPYCNPDGMGH
ncbi:MAG TPA: PD-(D/E)XK nuclease family protein, partial [Candidatus Nanopelagicales bacterium]|nr:PD-(D/E)XK nuclease family protein [Candidatus Nanopelagicales bacterium]